MKKSQQINSRKRCHRFRQLQMERTLWGRAVLINQAHLKGEDRGLLPRMVKQGMRRRNKALMALQTVI